MILSDYLSLSLSCGDFVQFVSLGIDGWNGSVCEHNGCVFFFVCLYQRVLGVLMLKNITFMEIHKHKNGVDALLYMYKCSTKQP